MITSPPWYDEPHVKPSPSISIGASTCRPSFSANSTGKDIMSTGVSKPVLVGLEFQCIYFYSIF